jgi:hypothetical protein
LRRFEKAVQFQENARNPVFASHAIVALAGWSGLFSTAFACEASAAESG